MYLYGYKKENLTNNLQNLLSIFADRGVVLDVGRECFQIDGTYVGVNYLKQWVFNDEEKLRNRFMSETNELDIVEVVKSLNETDINALKKYISKCVESYLVSFHTTDDYEFEDIVAIPRVVRNKKTNELEQLVAIRLHTWEHYRIYLFNDELKYLYDYETLIFDEKGILDFIRKNYSIICGLTMEVLSLSTDCTLKGISYYKKRLDVADCDNSGLIENGKEIYDIRNLLVIKEKEPIDRNETFYYVAPALNPRKWYTKGGNFVATSDNNFNFDYALPIFDRVES